MTEDCGTMQDEAVADADFYALVHSALESSRACGESVERRKGRRDSFSCQQWISPLREGSVPQRGSSQLVECLDISSSGFSFLANDLADVNRFVVGLGNPATLFVTAKVVRRTTVRIKGKDRIMLGCKFVAKVDDGSSHKTDAMSQHFDTSDAQQTPAVC